MAIITPFIAKGTHVGQSQAVKARKFVWISVGNGEVSSLSDYEVAIAGTISILGYSGDLIIRLLLLDEQPEASGGPCLLRLNTHVDEAATYHVKGAELTVNAVLGDKRQNITITRCNNGTQTECRLFGHVDQTVHLDPT